MHENLDLIFNENGLIKNIKPDYKTRPQQIEAAKQILESVKAKEHYLLEGPCGFGKTFAYLVPIFEEMHTNPKTLTVIVTNGKQLQTQLFQKDIPLVERIFESIYADKIPFASLKGKNNFICLHKSSETFMQPMQVPNDCYEQFGEIKKWFFGGEGGLPDEENKTKTGDFDELDFVVDSKLMPLIACTDDGDCKGKKCSAYNHCFYQRHKTKANNARIVITNYHVLFADIKVNRNLLPTYNILVLDEGHEAADIFRSFNESRAGITVIRNIQKAYTTIKRDESEYFSTITEIDRGIQNMFNLVMSDCESYFESLYNSQFKDNDFGETKILSFESPRLPDHEKLFEHINALSDYLCEIESDLNVDLELAPNSEKSSIESFLNNIMRLNLRFEDFKRLIVKAEDDCDGTDSVYWVEKMKRTNYYNKNSVRTLIKSMPVKVGHIFYEQFFGLNISTITTSATLSTGGNFNYIRDELGLENCSVNEFMGESPFDLPKQQLWYLPPNAVDGTAANKADFDARLPDQIYDIIKTSGGGALCLFTSIDSMNKTHRILQARIEALGITVYKQNEMAKTKILEEFKENTHSVLFATKSFFTGVDIPGEALRVLILDKLPFPSPGDPLMKKLEQIDGKGAFMKHSIPRMLISLKQGTGRGVRTETDKCVIAVMDNRLKTARYVGVIFKSFPYKITATQSLKDVEEFLK